ncbi:energy transducer TonB [Craterilacuibacter sp.]|uniref:energy transducer TonB n=1 Tax=Craterilacuibacter sp. TaxID=2870909 RepID=UPI003F2D367D
MHYYLDMQKNSPVIPVFIAVIALHSLLLLGARAPLQPPKLPPMAMQMVSTGGKVQQTHAVRQQQVVQRQPAANKPLSRPERKAIPMRTAARSAASPQLAALTPALSHAAQADQASLQAEPALATAAPSSGAMPGAKDELTLPQYRGDYLHNPRPAYPPLSLELAESGTVELRVDVSAAGQALAVELAKSSGYPRLDRAAREAVRQWRFTPARRGAQAIAHRFVVPIHFSLKSVQS